MKLDDRGSQWIGLCQLFLVPGFSNARPLCHQAASRSRTVSLARALDIIQHLGLFFYFENWVCFCRQVFHLCKEYLWRLCSSRIQSLMKILSWITTQWLKFLVFNFEKLWVHISYVELCPSSKERSSNFVCACNEIPIFNRNQLLIKTILNPMWVTFLFTVTLCDY
jgi:hypothetical protein